MTPEVSTTPTNLMIAEQLHTSNIPVARHTLEIVFKWVSLSHHLHTNNRCIALASTASHAKFRAVLDYEYHCPELLF
jgi:hypothetical protein